MKKSLLFSVSLLILPAFAAKALAPDYTDGIFFINEGNYGTPGLVNFLPRSGEMEYKVFSEANPDKQLGITTESASKFGSRIFIVSKMNGEGAFLTVVNAADMKFIAGITELPGANTQANYFSAVSESLGYLSTSNGLYPVNLTDYTVGGAVTHADLTGGAFGQSMLVGKRLFAVSKNDGIVVIDVDQAAVEQVIPIDKAKALSQAPDGTIYVATTNTSAEFVKLDPNTLATEDIDITVDDACVPDPWAMSWVMSPFSVSKDGKALFYATAPWSCRNIAKYDIAAGTFTPDFITLPADDQELYGQGMSVDPVTGNVVVTAVESGWGQHYLQNWVYFYSPDGSLLTDKTIHLEEFLWFPAMALYVNDTPDAIDTVVAQPAAEADVYTPAGVCVLRNASEADVRALPAGIYIYGNRKIAVK